MLKAQPRDDLFPFRIMRRRLGMTLSEWSVEIVPLLRANSRDTYTHFFPAAGQLRACLYPADESTVQRNWYGQIDRA